VPISALDGRAIPILPSRDLEETLDFYRSLGFAVIYEQRDPEPYAVLRKGQLELHFFELVQLDARDHSHGAYLRVSDAQAVHDELSSKVHGPARLHDIADRPWGMPEFALRDFSGDLLRVGHPWTDAARTASPGGALTALIGALFDVIVTAAELSLRR
jgi:catechol 2,3-dioxygenase-like lactoylglutathione lyase family enzyme